MIMLALLCVVIALAVAAVVIARRRRVSRELARLQRLLFALRADVWRELDRIEDEIR